MIRNEVVCSAAAGTSGHVFDDGPRDRGGLRYCMNSCAMEFDPAKYDRPAASGFTPGAAALMLLA